MLLLAEGIEKYRVVEVQPLSPPTDLALLLRELGLIAYDMASTVEVIDVEELLLVRAAKALVCLDDVLHCGVVDALVVRDPHLVFTEDLVHIDVIYAITVRDLLVWALLRLF